MSRYKISNLCYSLLLNIGTVPSVHENITIWKERQEVKNRAGSALSHSNYIYCPSPPPGNVCFPSHQLCPFPLLQGFYPLSLTISIGPLPLQGVFHLSPTISIASSPTLFGREFIPGYPLTNYFH